MPAGFYHGKNRLIPASGMNLPTLILCRREKFKDTEKVIFYHPFGIGIDTDIVFGNLVPESIAGSTEIPKYRISFGIPSPASSWSDNRPTLWKWHGHSVNDVGLQSFSWSRSVTRFVTGDSVTWTNRATISSLFDNRKLSILFFDHVHKVFIVLELSCSA